MKEFFARFWFVFVGILLLAEGFALSRNETGDTLSEFTWSKIHSFPMRMLLGAVLVWLVYHFLWSGPGRGLHRVDLVFATVGALVGLASYFFR